jgi:four helix bundle protein
MSTANGHQSSIKHFYDLNVWKEFNRLSVEIYKTTENFPNNEKYGITNQLRRASSSVGANIAEGFGRFHYKDKIKFYYNARGSVCEVQNFLFL